MDDDEVMVSTTNQSFPHHKSQSVSVQMSMNSQQKKPLKDVLEDEDLWIWDDNDEKDNEEAFMEYHDRLMDYGILEILPDLKVLVMPMFNHEDQTLSEKDFVHIVNGKCLNEECSHIKNCHHQLIYELIKRGNPSDLYYVVKFVFPTICYIIMHFWHYNASKIRKIKRIMQLKLITISKMTFADEIYTLKF